MTIPTWVDIVKTSSANELAPYDEDWYYIRAASIARKVYLNKGVGVGQLKRWYGGAFRKRCQRSHFRKACGQIIRTILKDLQKLGLVETIVEDSDNKEAPVTRCVDCCAGAIRFAAMFAQTHPSPAPPSWRVMMEGGRPSSPWSKHLWLAPPLATHTTSRVLTRVTSPLFHLAADACSRSSGRRRWTTSPSSAAWSRRRRRTTSMTMTRMTRTTRSKSIRHIAASRFGTSLPRSPLAARARRPHRRCAAGRTLRPAALAHTPRVCGLARRAVRCGSGALRCSG